MSHCLCCHKPIVGNHFIIQCWRTDTPQDISGNELFAEYGEMFSVCYDCSPPFLAEITEPMILKGEDDIRWVVDSVFEIKKKNS
jgi:hypothetical protein